MKRTGSPAVSPDGKYVVVSVTEPAYDSTKQISDLWIIPADGSAPPRRLTSTKGGESGVAWSPDSTQIAFSAKREGDEAEQIYVMRIQQGEAMRVTDVSTGAFDPKFSPDGNTILFQSRVWPGTSNDDDNRKIAKERKERKYNVRAYETLPIRQWDRWVDEKQIHILVQSLESGSKSRDLLAGTDLVRKPGFAGSGGGTGEDNLEAIWAPDGQSVVFTASINRDIQAYGTPTTHVYQVAAGGGEPKPLTSGEEASYSGPAFRPDGKMLYMVQSRESTKQLYSLNRLAVLPWPAAGAPRVITEQLDRSVDSFTFTPDSKTLYMICEEHGHDKLFTMPAEGGEARLALRVNLGGYSGVVSAGKSAQPVIVANWYSMVNPAEVARIDPAGGNHRALTKFTSEQVAELDWQPPRHFWFTSRQGKQIHSMIVLPPAFDAQKKYPLLVFMHGGPHNMWKEQFFLRWNFHLLATPGYVVLMTNYSGSTGFGEKFADSINQDVLKLPASEINQAADEAIRLFPFIDESRQAAGGASYGGYLSNWMQATTTRYKVLFNHAGLTNNESMWGSTDGTYFWELRYGGPAWKRAGQWTDQNPFNCADNFRTPMLITHGENDFRVPIGQAFEIFKLLQRRKVPSRLVVFPEENHWVLRGENSKYFFDEVFAWLKRYL
jgi:dipeptidyl aminopeptidase/acylaminoacyl peptidase